MSPRLPIVGVMGSGSPLGPDEAAVARALGRALAGLPVHLLTGGGGGAMAAVGRAFAEVADRRGLVVGVLPAAARDDPAPPPGYPDASVELAIRTHLPARGPRGADPDSRNHVNVLSADVVLGLAGGAGTRSEMALARRYGRPAAWLLPDDDHVGDERDGLPVLRELDAAIGFVRARLGLA